MKSLKTLVCVTSFLLSVSVRHRWPVRHRSFEWTVHQLDQLHYRTSFFVRPVTCTLTASGTVAGGVATISTSFTGGILCPLAQLKSLPTPG